MSELGLLTQEERLQELFESSLLIASLEEQLKKARAYVLSLKESIEKQQVRQQILIQELQPGQQTFGAKEA